MSEWEKYKVTYGQLSILACLSAFVIASGVCIAVVSLGYW